MRLIELFCGAGGMALGFRRAGFNLVRGYDFSEPALRIHEANLGSMIRKLTGVQNARLANLGSHDAANPALGDLLTRAPEIAGLAPDIIVGGPPCQPWSQAGPQKGEADERARLTDAFVIVVAVARPRYFVMENVTQLRRYGIFERSKAIFRRAGYGLTETILDASHYGVAQKRRRLILAGCLGEADGWLLDHLEGAWSKRAMTVADVLGPEFGRLREPGSAGSGRLYWLTPGGQSSAGTRRTDLPAPTISHGVRAGPGPGYRPKAGDVPDLKSLPIPTFEQLSLLGGFPPDWDWSPVRSEGERMQALANAVPPPMAEVIGRCIMAHARGERPSVKMTIPRDFEIWLRKTKKLPPTRHSQVVSELRAARRLLGRRAFDGLDSALSMLDKSPEFRSLSAARKSNLRAAVRLYAECAEHFAGE